jgi:predicted nucleic acid-binding protein/predicted DNA-binding protein
MTMKRVQMLLEPRQRRRLAELAKIQGKSVAEIAREAIDAGLAQMAQDNQQARMLAALESARQLRESMPLIDVDLVAELHQMRRRETMNSSAVVGAGLAVYSARHPHSTMAVRVMGKLSQAGTLLHAPGLWWFEVTSVIHKNRFAGLISDSTAYAALDILCNDLGVQPVVVPVRGAFDWATRLRQKAAYDGFYLAAAEQLGAELWTADQALVSNARQLGVSWVHWMGEAD